MSLTVLPRARIDALDHADYLDGQRDGLGAEFLGELGETYATLIDHPEIAGRIDTENRRLRNVRAWPIKRFKKYIAFYRLRGDAIVVLRVLHGSRDLEKLLSSPFFP